MSTPDASASLAASLAPASTPVGSSPGSDEGRSPRPWSKRAPDGRRWDDIVVGSGMGGMTTAALLAKLGRKVLVLEQHYVPGGYTHSFRRKGHRWDVGVHLVGEASERSITGRVLKALTDDRLRWTSVGAVYDTFHFPDGFSIGFPDRPEEFVRVLKEAFPSESAGIDAYMADIRGTVRAMRGWYLGRALPGRLARWLGGVIDRPAREAMAVTAEAVVHRHVRDPRLRVVLLAQWGYHGSPPAEASWAMQALTSRHFFYGGYYPVGGAQQIAPALLQTVADAGGWTRICADVAQLRVEGGRAVGVRMKDGEQIDAERVVSAIGAEPTVHKLLPPELREQGWARSLAGHRASAAHVCLYLGFKGDIRAAGATAASQWYYQTWSHAESTWPVDPSLSVQPRPAILFTSFPSLKDPEHQPGPGERHTGEIVTFVPYDTFSRWAGTPWRKRGADYEVFKRQMTEAMLEVLWERLPGLRGLLDHAELATPLSTELFVRPYRGSIYGLAATPDRFADPWLRPASPIPGLYLSGGDVSTCGIMGAMMGGLLCGLAMEPWKGVRFLRDLPKAGA
jgi:all-trans-retinol 13,14-reductase